MIFTIKNIDDCDLQWGDAISYKQSTHWLKGWYVGKVMGMDLRQTNIDNACCFVVVYGKDKITFRSNYKFVKAIEKRSVEND